MTAMSTSAHTQAHMGTHTHPKKEKEKQESLNKSQQSLQIVAGGVESRWFPGHLGGAGGGGQPQSTKEVDLSPGLLQIVLAHMALEVIVLPKVSLLGTVLCEAWSQHSL